MSTTPTPIILYPRGSEWRKWDLHVHTPSSLVHSYTGSGDPWPPFLDDLEALPPEFKVIGVNDYIFLDGYRRLLGEKKKGRLQNIDLLLPVIELRLDKFGGTHGHLSKVNYHVIFSDQIDPDIIEQHFLNALPNSYQVSPQYEQLAKGKKWTALPTKKSLADLGTLIIDSVPEEEKSKFGSPLIEGFNNLCFSLEKVEKALEAHYFENKFITAVGKTEWADIKWNDQSIAEKKNIINRADIVFVSAESPDDWAKAQKALTNAAVNDLLLDCSDAHHFSSDRHKDRIGNAFTWIKADPTFEGLQQILTEPDERIFVGAVPPKLERVRTDPTRYIRSIDIKKKAGASLREIWFGNEIPFNSGLVAIIGNKGKGKSALADTLGLLGNTRQHRAFSFLSEKGFRNPKDNKARCFLATLTWESGSTEDAQLDAEVDETKPELVKYLPQNFLETICNEIASENETSFDKELKKVIFSHVEPPDRLGYANLDGLLAFRTEEANARLSTLRTELHLLNEQIIELEERNSSSHRKALENRLALKQKEVAVYESRKPDARPKPAEDPQNQQKSQDISAQISSLSAQRKAIEAEITATRARQASYAVQSAAIEKTISKVSGFKQQADTFLREFVAECAKLEVEASDIVKVTINDEPLIALRDEVAANRRAADESLDPKNAASLVVQVSNLAQQVLALQQQLDEPNRQYQAYLRELEEWERGHAEQIGDENTIGSLKFLEKQVADLELVPKQLQGQYDERLAKAKTIHAEIAHLADTYRGLYAPVQDFIDHNPIARDRFHLSFEVAIVMSGFEDKLLAGILNRGASGTFAGIEEGSRMLRTIIRKHDLGTDGGIESFLKEMMDSLNNDKRGQVPIPVSISSQLRKGIAPLTLYDYLFSLEFLRPRYRLSMGGKELNQLSPGERGTLLLVFYLLVDKEQIPLIIDQPEENLDNQTVFELLVPCIKETKERRQLIIVTHNPNLAVVCDAEQIVCAFLDKPDNYRMKYLSGSIECPVINREIVDILEGTRPAFNNRDSKYEISREM